MPAPGPVAYQVHCAGFTSPVIWRGGDQVSPSSPLSVSQAVPRPFALAVHDVPFPVAAQVMGHEQDDLAGLALDDGTGVAASVVVVGPDDLLPREGSAPVGAPLQEQIDLARVVVAELSAFAEGQHGPPRGDDHRRNAIGAIAVLAAGVDVNLLRLDGGRGGEQRQNERGINHRVPQVTLPS